MSKTAWLKVFYAAIFAVMFFMTIKTSLQSNLLKVYPAMLNEPWTVATLVDFYLNILIIFSWVVYKEDSWVARILWLIGFVTLGSLITSSYVLVQIFELRPGEGVREILLRRREA